MIDFVLSSEQMALADNVRRFVERDYGFEARQTLTRSAEGYSPAHWATFAELGWLGAGLSEDAGGFGGGAIENALIAEQFGKGLVVEPFAATVHALQALAAMADLEGRTALIESAVSGETKLAVIEGAVAATNGKLSGTARAVLGGPSADRLLVAAHIGARADMQSGLFLVERAAPGLGWQNYRTLDNNRVSDFVLDGVEAVQLCGDARMAVQTGRDHATVTLCAEAVGAMDAALWMTRDYLKTRQQFGRPISEFQALQFRMADMLVECEMARSMLYQGLAAFGAPDQSRRIAAAKAMISEAGLFVGRQAIQLHGGIGMTEEYAIGHYYKRLHVIAHLFGPPDVQIEKFIALEDTAPYESNPT